MELYIVVLFVVGAIAAAVVIGNTMYKLGYKTGVVEHEREYQKSRRRVI